MRHASHIGAYLIAGVGHVCATAIIAGVMTLCVLPVPYIEPVARHVWGVERVFQMSVPQLAIHVGLAACLWALIVIVYKLILLQRRDRARRPIRLSRGSVMTETLIILPVFFLLTFGMAQLVISNIAAILANVAAYQAARAAWIWQPEEDASEQRMGIEEGIAKEKCRIATAVVMLPVANGEFETDDDLPDNAEKMRNAAVMAHVPFGGTLASLSPELTDFLTGADVMFNDREAVERNKSYVTALDTLSFLRRTATKFTHAFHASDCEIDDDHSVKMTYDLQLAMPLVGRVFGELRTVGGRKGYYAKYTREFGLKKQAMLPNAKLPENSGEYVEPSEPDVDAELESGSNEVDIP